MTRLERRNYGRNHGYRIDGTKVPGVTTILNVMAKPALTNWAANMVAEEAINRWDELATWPVAARLRELASAHRRNLNRAAARGTDIHNLGESLTPTIVACHTH